MKTIGLILVSLSLLALSAGAWATGPYTPDANTVALYHLDGNALDASANGYNGTLGGTNSWVSSAVYSGGLLAGDANGDYGGFTSVVGIPSTPFMDTGSGVVVDGWFKLTASVPDADYMLGGTGGVMGQMYFTRVLYNGSICFGVQNQAGWVQNTTAAGIMPVNAWTHIKLVSQNNNTDCYVNDALQFTLGGCSVSMVNLIVGGVPWAPNWSPNAFQGQVDEIRLEGAVPEPGSLLALGSALIGFCGIYRRRSK